jgi:hypothetical protein
MTDLERIELALRKAMSAPNPHQKCEVYFRNFVEELTAMNNQRHEFTNELWCLYERDKARRKKFDDDDKGTS